MYMNDQPGTGRMNDTITLTHVELAEIIARAVATALASQAPSGPVSGAERARAYRNRKSSQSVTNPVTPSEKPSRTVTENVTPPSPPSPPLLSPTPPILPAPAPTPMHMQATRMREEPGELFEIQSDKPHKRIGWNSEAGFTGINAKDKADWFNAFPACDIDRQLSEADLWLRANPAKSRKQNFFRFLTNWLGRKQERGGDAPRASPGKPYSAPQKRNEHPNQENQPIPEL